MTAPPVGRCAGTGVARELRRHPD